MRHQKKTVKLGRTAEHRNALLANQATSLIEHGRIRTTLAKAKAVRPLADKMVTLAKKNTLHARRTALALLHNNSERTEKAVKKLFAEIGPRSAGRQGGYTRIVKLGARMSDSAPMAYLEWVDAAVPAAEEAPVQESKPQKKAVAKKDAKDAKPSEDSPPA
ncbi:MAG: 50S ribosomal protein L17 [Terrimicrobiaceae bacterium]